MTVRKNPRGIFLTDLMLALVMATALLMAMTAAVSALHRGEQRLADARTAARRLESALTSMRNGTAPDPEVTIARFSESPVGGLIWVKVSLPANRGGPGQSLIGLVPAASVAAGAHREHCK